MFFQEKKEQLAFWAEKKLAHEYSKKTLWRFFSFAMFGNIICYLVPLITPQFLAEPTGTLINIEGRIGMYLLLVPFLCGTLMTNSVIKIFFVAETAKKNRVEFFISYSDKISDDRHRTALLVSLGGGGANCIILFFTVIWGRMALYQ